MKTLRLTLVLFSICLTIAVYTRLAFSNNAETSSVKVKPTPADITQLDSYLELFYSGQIPLEEDFRPICSSCKGDTGIVAQCWPVSFSGPLFDLKTKELTKMCGSWLHDYVDFHKSSRGSPHAKYLIWACTTGGCGGFGSRIFGILTMLKAAALSNRVLIIVMNEPFSLETAFLPNLINWHLDEQLKKELSIDREFLNKGNKYIDGHGWAKAEELKSELFSEKRDLVIQTNIPKELLPFPNNYINEQIADEYLLSCAFHTMFQMSPSLAEQVADAERNLLGNTHDYIGVHVRSFAREEGVFERVYPGRTLTSLLNLSLACAKSLRDSHYPGSPIFLSTDNPDWKGEASTSLVSKVKYTNFEPIHSEQGNGTTREFCSPMHVTNFVDLILLSKSSKLVGTASSYTGMAKVVGVLQAHSYNYGNCQPIPSNRI